MRKCIKCEAVKPLTSFVKEKRNKDGVAGTCKSCRNAERFTSPIPHKAFWRLNEKQKKYNIDIETDKHEITQVFDMFTGHCTYCNVKESEDTGTLQLEHIIPMARGGRHHVSNLVIACKRCNAKKRNMPLIEFYRAHPPFTGAMLDFVFMYVARFSGRDPEEVAKEFYAEVAEVENGKTPRK